MDNVYLPIMPSRLEEGTNVPKYSWTKTVGTDEEKIECDTKGKYMY